MGFPLISKAIFRSLKIITFLVLSTYSNYFVV